MPRTLERSSVYERPRYEPTPQNYFHPSASQHDFQKSRSPMLSDGGIQFADKPNRGLRWPGSAKTPERTKTRISIRPLDPNRGQSPGLFLRRKAPHPQGNGKGSSPASSWESASSFFPQLWEPPTDLSLVRKFYQWLTGPHPSSPPGGGVVVKNAPGHALEGRNCKNAKNLRYKNLLMGGVKKLGASGLSLILVSLSFWLLYSFPPDAHCKPSIYTLVLALWDLAQFSPGLSSSLRLFFLVWLLYFC